MQVAFLSPARILSPAVGLTGVSYPHNTALGERAPCSFTWLRTFSGFRSDLKVEFHGQDSKIHIHTPGKHRGPAVSIPAEPVSVAEWFLLARDSSSIY